MTLEKWVEAAKQADKLIRKADPMFFMLLQHPISTDKTEPYVYAVRQWSPRLREIYYEYRNQYLPKSLVYEIAYFCPTGARIKLIPFTLPHYYCDPCALECKKELETKEQKEPEMK